MFARHYPVLLFGIIGLFIFSAVPGTVGRATASLSNPMGVYTHPHLAVLNVHAIPVDVSEGFVFTQTVAHVTYTNRVSSSRALGALIQWGDGSRSAAPVSDEGDVSSTHRYIDEGRYPITVTVRDSRGDSATDVSTASIGDADSFFSPVSDPRPAQVGHPVKGQIAVFFDTGYLQNSPHDFSATINWGDGTKTAGVVTASSGLFAVSGKHVYASSHLYWVTVRLRDRPPGRSVGVTRVPIDVK